jgi:hypothetical protein
MSRQTGKEVTVTSLRVPRRLITAAVLAGIALLATACGPSARPRGSHRDQDRDGHAHVAPGPVAAAPQPSPTGSPPAGGLPDQRAARVHRERQRRRGQRVLPDRVHELLRLALHLFGFPGVSFVTSPNGSQIGDAATRQSDKPVQTVTLAPGGVAHATLQVVQALNFPAAKCQPVTAHFLKIYPPNQTAAVVLSFTAKACAATGQGVTVLNVAPVQPAAVDS